MQLEATKEATTANMLMTPQTTGSTSCNLPAVLRKSSDSLCSDKLEVFKATFWASSESICRCISLSPLEVSSCRFRRSALRCIIEAWAASPPATTRSISSSFCARSEASVFFSASNSSAKFLARAAARTAAINFALVSAKVLLNFPFSLSRGLFATRSASIWLPKAASCLASRETSSSNTDAFVCITKLRLRTRSRSSQEVPHSPHSDHSPSVQTCWDSSKLQGGCCCLEADKKLPPLAPVPAADEASLAVHFRNSCSEPTRGLPQ
mmetsp:Transcript_49890/g.126867  ORF Transcript_49890/g.126867 Transcript_49890/m.126867 type:complete len:266 (+) Transcript_49890:557-1354(+)